MRLSEGHLGVRFADFDAHAFLDDIDVSRRCSEGFTNLAGQGWVDLFSDPLCTEDGELLDGRGLTTQRHYGRVRF